VVEVEVEVDEVDLVVVIEVEEVDLVVVEEEEVVLVIEEEEVAEVVSEIEVEEAVLVEEEEDEVVLAIEVEEVEAEEVSKETELHSTKTPSLKKKTYDALFSCDTFNKRICSRSSSLVLVLMRYIVPYLFEA